jgi:VanZ family protein
LGRQPPRRGFFPLFIRYWLPVLVYLTVIFSLSAQPNLKPPMSFQNSDKFWHVLEYGGLGLLLGRALRAGQFARAALVAAGVALAAGSLIGAADETFQRSIPGRESSAADWAADTAGVALAQGALLWLALDPRRAARWL